MVRISDILKQKGGLPEPGKDKKEEQPIKEKPQESAKEKQEESQPDTKIQFAKAITEGAPQAQEEMQVAKTMREMQFSAEQAAKVYNRSLEVIREILDKAKSDVVPDLKDAYEIVREIVDRIVLGDKELIALTASFSEGNYLYAHAANICILCIDVGLGLGYNKSKLNELGLGVFLSDIGMVKVMEIIKEPRRLNERELAEVKKHPNYSADILSRVKDIQEAVVYIAKQEHERINGTGYPQGLKDGEIHEYARIVGVVDVYEALTHPRPHRKAIDPHSAVKELVSMNSNGLFETSILKLLINRIGLYPVGSWVELNTGEIGKVTVSNENFPLRPKLNIIFGQDKERIDPIKSVDLFKQANLFIKKSANPKDLKLG